MSMNLKINRYDTKKEKRRKLSDVVYLVITMSVFAAAGISMFIFPRSTESALEKRDLAEFPKFTVSSFTSGEYTQDISTYFSDTVPFRDALMVVSSAIRDMTGFRLNNIKLHNVTRAENSAEAPVELTEIISEPDEIAEIDEMTQNGGAAGVTVTEPPHTEETQGDYTPITTAESAAAVEMDDTVNITNNGIAVVGTRALMLYGGNPTVGENYAKVISKYKQELGGVNVYCMVIPTSVEFYCPDSVKQYTSSQLDNINNIYSHLENGVKPIDVYSPLNLHSGEDIYLRTDHHWSSLGAYYAAKQFAEAADVPFADLTEYDEKRVSGYVGTMYSYTQDIVIQNNPEDFVYYVPKNVEYKTTYRNYILDEKNAIIGIQKPVDANFFIDFSKNKPMLYCTFMGGDAKITQIKTSAGNGRKLAIFKDSYGNALPQFLFGSFEEIYVLDMRFFTYNAIDFFKENGITDLLFANNAFHATTKSTVTHYENFLVQNRNTVGTQTVTSAPAQTAVTTTVTTPPTETTVPAVVTRAATTTTTRAATETSAAVTEAETTKKKPKKTTASETTEKKTETVTTVTETEETESTETSPREFFEPASTEEELIVE